MAGISGGAKWAIGVMAAMSVVASGCGLDALPSPTPPDLSPLDSEDSRPLDRECVDDSDCHFDPALPSCDRNQHRCVACQPNWSCPSICLRDSECNKLGGGSLCCNTFCVNPASDVKNCGGCGMACMSVVNGSPGCARGTCVVAACNPGYDDCDHMPGNGCETEVARDPMNCGACGKVCIPFANGVPMCTVGKCAAVCAPGFADCDNDTKDGCEVDTRSDGKNCGKCGAACPEPMTCIKGKCG